MTRIDATFEITRWDAETYDAPAEGPPSTRAVVGKAYAGAPVELPARCRVIRYRSFCASAQSARMSFSLV